MLSVDAIDYSVGHARSLVQQEGSLDLVLALLVAGRGGLVADVPAVVIDLSGVAASVGDLPAGVGEGLVAESVPDVEPLGLII